MKKTPIVSFGLLSDCQYTDEGNETYIIPSPEQLSYDCRYRESPVRLREAVDFFNTQELNFIVHLGDFIDRRFDEIQVLSEITHLSHTPFLHVLGNHEYKDKSEPISAIVEAYGMPSRYYAKDIASYRFIVIDSNEEGVIAANENSEAYRKGKRYIQSLAKKGHINAYPWNGGVSKRQMTWIKARLDEAEESKKSVIFFSHHPIFPPGPLNMLNDNEFLALVDKYSVIKAFFNGHNHLGTFGNRSDVPYITAAGIVEGEGNAYGTVHLFADGSGAVTGYGRQESYSW